jgi:nitrate/TMAO reductase-like tetraheme cytochrome c subunit
MRQPLFYVLLILFVVVGLLAAADYSSRSAACMLCHQQEASFASWMTEKLRKEKRGFSHEMITCADCHIQGNPSRTMASRFRSLLHAISYLVPQIDPRTPPTSGMFNRTRVPTENCQYCHYASVYRKAVHLKDLPEGLKPIGLVMDHRKHVLARENTCAQCHERYKPQLDAAPDKGVNYAEVNHLACDACHSFASHAYRSGRLLPMTQTQYEEARTAAWERLGQNPRWMVAIPSEQTCRRCHNGQIHFKTQIFPADCRTGSNYDNCIKCHPLMTKSYFEDYMKGKEKPQSAGQTTVPGEDMGDAVSKDTLRFASGQENGLDKSRATRFEQETLETMERQKRKQERHK